MTHLSDRAYMTPLLNRIADVAGERAALILGREKAGLQIYIPEKATPDHWLSLLIGVDAANAMAGVWGSKHIVVPPAMNGDKRRRAATIAELIEKGYSNNQIVQMTGVSRRTVIEHRRKQPDDRQASLF